MKPQEDFHNGDGGAGADDSEGEEASSALEDELSLHDEGAPARALAALNALRKSRQHYDVLLVAGGAEIAAHCAVLAATSPYLLETLAAPSPPASSAAPAYRVDDVEPDALKELVEYAYTGRLRVRETGAARRLYLAAWRLRVEAVRSHLASRLLRRLSPQDCLELRALPDLVPDQLALLDAYIAQNFEELCSMGALGGLPLIRIEMLRATSAEGGEETPVAVADAALTWLRDRHSDADLEELCSRTHLLFVDGGGALRDCGELPETRADVPELQQYRREAAARDRTSRRRDVTSAPRAHALPALELGARTAKGASDCAVLAARKLNGGSGGARTTRALFALRGRLAVAKIAWRDVGGADGAGVARGGVLGGSRGEPDEGERRARLSVPRCAHGTAALGSRLFVCGGYDRTKVLQDTEAYDPLTNTWSALPNMRSARARKVETRLSVPRCAHGTAALGSRLFVCGGYDRAKVLQDTEAYDPLTNTWSALPNMRSARARFPAARLGRTVYVIGGSDGHAELDSVDVYEEREDGGGRWKACSKLPFARSHAAAAVDEERGEVYVIGGWAGGRSLKQVHKYSPLEDAWSEAPPLTTGRSQCAGVAWENALWVLGGCDAWHCLATTETLSLSGGGWVAGPALPTARRSVGGAVWRERLVSAGGSDGAASLKKTEWLEPGSTSWATGPSLRRARAALGLAVLGDVLYAAGGFDGKEFLWCVECLYSPDGEWSTLCSPPALPATPSTPLTPEMPSALCGKEKQENEAKENGSAIAQ